MKKILAVILLLILSLSLIACNKNPEGMVLVKAGTTTKANNQIRVSEDFYISKYLVTQAEFAERMDFNFNPAKFSGKPNNPIENITWYDAVKYCENLSKAEELEPYYNISQIRKKDGHILSAEVTINRNANGYRLPTNSEWEYSARGGARGDETIYAGSDDLDEVGWYIENSDKADSELSRGIGTMPVGELKANELGLYDMSGNVAEWTNTLDSSEYIIRGGAWILNADNSKLNNSGDKAPPNARAIVIGFRLARNLE